MPDQTPTPPMQCITASFARTQFGQILARAGSNRERFVVTKNGQETMVILGIEDFLQSAGNAAADLNAIRTKRAERAKAAKITETK
ncbi:MAG TPA: type II toxin-antitoxin system Phd/YefM family antitoxin [Candidatus Binatia bacterium]|nr:type II toxin-antitoxin system Phd/YefM family antitoxin [Candidatus Binatia bacterium]